MKISDKFDRSVDVKSVPAGSTPPAPQRTFGGELWRVFKITLQCVFLGVMLILLPLIGLCVIISAFAQAYFRAMATERIPSWRRRIANICDAAAKAAKN